MLKSAKNVVITAIFSVLPLTSVLASGITLCPLTAQCPDSDPHHCYVGNGFLYESSSKEQVTSGTYEFSYAVFEDYSVIVSIGAECSYFLNNDPLNRVSFNRSDLKNVAPMPGNLWRPEGHQAYSCQMEAAPFKTVPSQCPFIAK